MGYQTVRALTPIRHSGVLRIPGQTSGDNAQDFVAEDTQANRLVALGYATSLGVAAAPVVPGQAAVVRGADNASAILAMAAASPLRLPLRSFRNSWSNYNAAVFPPLTVTVGPTGLMEFSGVIKPSAVVPFASGQSLAELPIGFAPDLQHRSPAVLLNQDAGNAASPCEAILFGNDSGVPTLAIEANATTVTKTPLMGVSARAYTSTVRAAIYWRNAVDGDDVSVIVPPAALVPGVSVKVALWCHGAADDYLSHLSDQNAGSSSNRSRAIIMGLLNDGWIVVGVSAKSSVHWGNPGAWAAQARAIDWLKSWLTIGKMVAVGQSMGGTLSLHALAAYPEITTWYGIYPVCDITNVNAAYSTDITAAYAPHGGVAANLTTSNPTSFPAGTYAGKRLLCTASPGDSAVPKATNADALRTKAIADGAAVATVTATTGEHGDASHFTPAIVTAMLAHLNG